MLCKCSLTSNIKRIYFDKKLLSTNTTQHIQKYINLASHYVNIVTNKLKDSSYFEISSSFKVDRFVRKNMRSADT